MPKKAFLNLGEADRKEMIDKAMQLYVDHPYAGITLKMILEKLTLHPTTFYRYFEDKDELYCVLLHDLAIKRKEYLGDRAPFYGSSLFISDYSNEPLTELEVRFVKTVLHLPLNVLTHIYMVVFKDETVSILKNRLRRMRYEGKLRPDIDDDLIAFIGATIPVNLILFCREAGIEDEDLLIKLNKYFFDSFFLHGIMKDSELPES
jgi:AcrR family transcriptional regulator